MPLFLVRQSSCTRLSLALTLSHVTMMQRHFSASTVSVGSSSTTTRVPFAFPLAWRTCVLLIMIQCQGSEWSLQCIRVCEGTVSAESACANSKGDCCTAMTSMATSSFLTCLPTTVVQCSPPSYNCALSQLLHCSVSSSLSCFSVTSSSSHYLSSLLHRSLSPHCIVSHSSCLPLAGISSFVRFTCSRVGFHHLSFLSRGKFFLLLSAYDQK